MLGPVAVSIDASSTMFGAYQSGVITDAFECGTDLDHAVTAVGYSVNEEPNYYLVRNSWGADWGENGYVRIGIQSGPGVCGIQMEATYASLVLGSSTI